MEDNNQKRRKPSYMQTRAVEVWLRDGRKSKARALRIAGYGKAIIRHPDRVFGSHIVQNLMREAGIQDVVHFRKMTREDNELPIGATIEVKAPSPTLDISKITPEQWRWLKAELASLPPTPLEERREWERRMRENEGISNRPLLEMAKYGNGNNPFESGNLSYTRNDDWYWKESCM